MHDINKLPQFQEQRRSFNVLASRENLAATLADLEMGRFFEDYEVYLDDMLTLARMHSGHCHTSAETLDRRYDPYRLGKQRIEQELIHLIRAVNVIDLSMTLEERAKKVEFLRHLNTYTQTQYEFVYHKTAEQRGILTNLIHREVVTYLRKEKGLIPLLLYPDGVAYLKERGREIDWTTADLAELGQRVVQRVESKTRADFRQFIRNTSQGIKIDPKCLTLGLSFSEMFNEVRNVVLDKTYVRRLDQLVDRIRARLESTREKLAGQQGTEVQILRIEQVLEAGGE